MTVLDHAPAAAPDRHIASYTSLPTPAELCEELPLEPARAEQIARSREAVRAVLDGSDDRLLVIVGPCSIHDPEAGLDYARLLAGAQDRSEEHTSELQSRGHLV